MYTSKFLSSLVITTFLVNSGVSSRNHSTINILSEEVRSRFNCHCDVCSESNFQCETNGFCYISREHINGTVIVKQRCYDNHTNSHYQFPYFCEKSYSPGIQANCCKAKLCNDENVLPAMGSKPAVIETSLLTCHCSHCASNHFVCETDGACYLTWIKKKDGLIFTQGCLDRKYFFPPDEPIFCELRQVEDYGRMCCQRNFCNAEDLKIDPGLNVYALFFFIAFIISLSMIFYLNLR